MRSLVSELTETRSHGPYTSDVLGVPGYPDQPSHPVDVNAVVLQAVRATEPYWCWRPWRTGHSIKVQLDLEPVPLFRGDPEGLRVALVNLVVNAVEAMPLGGAITLRTWRMGSALVLEVADTGIGMTEEACRRCFEPYFTTKGDVASGLGLAMVENVVRLHHGNVEVESVAWEGTVFRMYLPLPTT